jgi:hypothetical protein
MRLLVPGLMTPFVSWMSVTHNGAYIEGADVVGPAFSVQSNSHPPLNTPETRPVALSEPIGNLLEAIRPLTTSDLIDPARFGKGVAQTEMTE